MAHISRELVQDVRAVAVACEQHVPGGKGEDPVRRLNRLFKSRSNQPSGG